MCTRAVPLRLPEPEAYAPEADLGDVANRTEQADLGEQVEHGCGVHRHCVRASFFLDQKCGYCDLLLGYCCGVCSSATKLVAWGAS